MVSFGKSSILDVENPVPSFLVKSKSNNCLVMQIEHKSKLEGVEQLAKETVQERLKALPKRFQWSLAPAQDVG